MEINGDNLKLKARFVTLDEFSFENMRVVLFSTLLEFSSYFRRR